MKVEQIQADVNSIAQQVLGEKAPVITTTSNLVSFGETVENMEHGYELMYKALLDRIGRVLSAIRQYESEHIPVRRSPLEWGCILQKFSFEAPEAKENPAWDFEKQKNPYDIENNMKVMAKYFKAMVGFSFETLVYDQQLKTAFTSFDSMASFINGIYMAINNKFNLTLENLDRLAIATAIAKTMQDGNANQKRNLLAEYNAKEGTKLTVAQCMSDRGFFRYAGLAMSTVLDNMRRPSKVFNTDGWERFTPRDSAVVMMLQQFAKAYNVYLSSDVFHKELVSLPLYDEVPYWQGSGTTYAFEDVSAVKITHAGKGEQKAVNYNGNGIIGVIADIDSTATTCLIDKTASMYNQFSEVTAYMHKGTTGYLHDSSENFVVFYVADVAE